MRLISLLALVGLLAAPAFATPARLQDGAVVFAYGDVNGNTAWTLDEYNAAVAYLGAQGGTTTVNSSLYTPTSTEVAISTNIGQFKNVSEFRDCLTRAGLRVKFKEMFDEYSIALELNDRKTQQKFQRLKEIFVGLP